jgi:hypothetical protein
MTYDVSAIATTTDKGEVKFTVYNNDRLFLTFDQLIIKYYSKNDLNTEDSREILKFKDEQGVSDNNKGVHPCNRFEIIFNFNEFLKLQYYECPSIIGVYLILRNNQHIKVELSKEFENHYSAYCCSRKK